MIKRKKKHDELLINIKEVMKHLRELYNARVNKLSWDILATMNSDTTSKAKLQKRYKPTEAVALPRMSWAANARNTKRNLSDNYMAPEFRETFEQVAKATIQEVHRARYKSLGRIVPYPKDRSLVCLGARERTMDSPELVGPVTSEARVRSRVNDLRKNLSTRRTFGLVAADHPRACLNGMS